MATKSAKKGGKWMQSAVKPENRGKFTAKAKAQGKGVQEYAEDVLENPKAPTKLKREASFAKTAKAISSKHAARGKKK